MTREEMKEWSLGSRSWIRTWDEDNTLEWLRRFQ